MTGIQEVGDYKPEKGLCCLSNNQTDEIRLFKLWVHLSATNELEKTVLPECRQMMAFINHLKSTEVTLYHLNPSGEINFLFWFSPASKSQGEKTAFAGLWLKRDFRKSKKALKLINNAYQLLFLNYNYCLGTTWQKSLFKVSESIGYRILAKVPSLYGINDVYFIGLSKDDFQSFKLHSIANKVRESEVRR
jgi:hypothetical protein